MEITADTPTIQVLPLLTDEYLETLIDKLPARAMKTPIWNMTCGEFIRTLDDDWFKTFFKEETIGAAIGHLKTYREDMKNLDTYLKLNEITETSEEKQAKRGVVFPTFAEDILLTVAEFFSLKSLEEAESVPFADYLIIQKRNSANAKFERNLQKQFEMKSKAKSGKRK